MNITTYIGVDPATRTGFAYYFPFSNEATVFECPGNPLEQWAFLKAMIEMCPSSLVCMEVLHHFRNAITTRDILQRSGYLKWSSTSFGYTPREVSTPVIRSFLKCKSKEEVKELFAPHYSGIGRFTDNHSDALAVAMFSAYLDGHLQELEIPKIGALT